MGITQITNYSKNGHSIDIVCGVDPQITISLNGDKPVSMFFENNEELQEFLSVANRMVYNLIHK